MSYYFLEIIDGLLLAEAPPEGTYFRGFDIWEVSSPITTTQVKADAWKNTDYEYTEGLKDYLMQEYFLSAVLHKEMLPTTND